MTVLNFYSNSLFKAKLRNMYVMYLNLLLLKKIDELVWNLFWNDLWQR
jgi:hypothetical protein